MEVVYIMSLTVSLLLGGLILLNVKKNKANLFLFGILFIAITGTIVNIIYLNNKEQYFLYYISFVDALPSLFGILLFFYVKHSIYPNTRINKYYVIYLIPFFIAFFLSLFSNLSEKDNILILITLNIVLKNILSLYFIILAISKLKQYKVSLLDNYSAIAELEFKWLKFLTNIAFYFWILYLLMIVMLYANINLPFNPSSIIYIGLSIFIFTISTYGIYNSNTFSNIKPIETDSSTQEKKPPKTILDEDSINKLFEKIEAFILSEKCFLDKDIALEDLSKMVSLHSKKCSEVINRKTNSNYFDFINSFRVNYFNEQILKTENKKLTIISVAFECGFSSKSTFNRIYKKQMGITPSKYIALPINL